MRWRRNNWWHYPNRLNGNNESAGTHHYIQRDAAQYQCRIEYNTLLDIIQRHVSKHR